MLVRAGPEVKTVLGGLTRCVPEEAVPGRPVNTGNSRSLTDSPVHRLTCVQAG